MLFIDPLPLRRVRNVLNDDEDEVFVWGNHNLVFLASNAKKREVICGIKISNTMSSLGGEGRDEVRILVLNNRVFDCASNGCAVLVNHDDASHVGPLANSIKRFLDLRHLQYSQLLIRFPFTLRPTMVG